MMEKMMMEGVCRGCGQIVNVNASDQLDADHKATEQCGCQGAKEYIAKIRMMQNIESLCGHGCEEQGFKRVPEDTLDVIKQSAKEIFNGHIDKSQFATCGSVVTVKRNERKVIVDRKKTVSIEAASEI